MDSKFKKLQLWLNLIIFSIVFCVLSYFVFFYNPPCVNCNVVELATYTPTVSPTTTPPNTPTKIFTKKPTSTPTINIPTSTNTPTLTPTKKPTPTRLPANIEWCVSAINTCGTRIRTQPYLTSTIIGIMYNNEPHITDINSTGIVCYKLVDYVEVKRVKWYVIQYRHHKQYFYVHPEYSKLNPLLP